MREYRVAGDERALAAIGVGVVEDDLSRRVSALGIKCLVC